MIKKTSRGAEPATSDSFLKRFSTKTSKILLNITAYIIYIKTLGDTMAPTGLKEDPPLPA